MSKVILGSRIVLGLIFLVFGLNGFFNFLPPQPPLPENALNFIMALVNTGYLLKLVKALEVIAGLALLSNRFVPLALLVLAPIVVNIFLFHTILAPAGAVLAIVIVVLTILVALGYKESFSHVLKA